MELTRKDLLKLGLLGSAALVLPLERTARTRLKIRNRLPESKLPKPFTVPFAAPPVLKPVRRSRTTDYFQITMKASRAQVLPGDFGRTTVYGYNGIVPGPTLKVRQGRRAVVRQINRLPRNGEFGYPQWTSVHLHGSGSKPQYDGYASDITRPGQYKDYQYPNFQDARTLWYHDHGVHHTAQNVYMGLVGQYQMHDDLELSLPIPHGRYDVPIVIQDAIFARDGSLVYDDEGHSSIFGDVVLVNGRPWPRMKVERRKYRFRILNASVSRSYRFALDSGDPFTVIATDAGLMPRPQQVQEFRHSQAERYEVIIDFARYKIGDKITLKNLSNDNNQDFSSTEDIMRFDVVSNPTSRKGNSIPDRLNPRNEIMHLKETGKERTAEINVIRKHGLWTINGQTWSDVIESGFRKVVANPRLNETQVWTLENPSGGWFHPLHVHLIDFKILDRNGKPPFPYERGPKDVAYLGENEKVRVIARFGPHRGRYMVHCHNLVHEDHDMMVQFEVGKRGDDPIEADRARPLRRMRRL
jgi:spore coat protein A, manganese oxidase